ncbi:hypothetical protein NDNC_1140 [Candidatus Nasuia deltocephalinicola]|nr:hypothetical protein NDNC_1140 [Candidatus Nasuia deltocephalinicola]
MINFYNYFNFFYFNKKNIFNFLINIWFSKKRNINKKIIVFSVLLNSTKLDIKNNIEFFLGIKIYKINTLILKSKSIKKAFIYFNEFI